MAIIDPVKDKRRTMLTANAATRERFSAAIEAEFTIELERPVVKHASRRVTEPLVEQDIAVEETIDVLIEEEAEEETDALEEFPAHARRASISTTKQATGAEDAFQSYLRDIRGLG